MSATLTMTHDNRREGADLPRYRLGIDIGGTFTDIVLLGSHDGSIKTKKVLSTPDNYSRAVVAGAVELLTEHGIALTEVVGLVHATTVASNTVLEGRGARTALITTKGFRDVLEMRRLRIPVLYDLQYEKPAPLVPRRYRYEVEERLGPRGEVWQPLNEAQVEAVALALGANQIESVAVCLLHAYANPAHEHRIQEIVRRVLGDQIYITCSADILPEIREYERMSTTVVNAYLGPVIDHYLASLNSQLQAAQLGVPVEIMQSSGGRMTPAVAVRQPAHLVESGPAAGVIACAQLARLAGYENLISLDMGGTTAKAALLEGGQPVRTAEYEVGAGINLSSKLIKGGGYPVRLPIIDVSEIGAGGGSLVQVDEFGRVRVGPVSAGADPGPVCYDKGGTAPTLTDALLVLGYLNPAYLVGGALRLNREKAYQALEETVARPLQRPVLEAAYGIFSLAVATMTRAVKAVTTYRGRDPRDFVLCGFGGNGPVTAAQVARVLQIGRVVIPPVPGVFSALGLLFSEAEQELVRTLLVNTAKLAPATLEAAYEALEAEALASMVEQGHAAERVAFRRQAHLRYAGQTYELEVPVAPGPVNIERLVDDFVAEHERTYGHASRTEDLDVVTVRSVARVPASTALRYEPRSVRANRNGAAHITRPAYFGPEDGLLDVPVVTRADLATPQSGPLLIDEYDSTCLVPPGSTAHLDAHNNIEINIHAKPRA